MGGRGQRDQEVSPCFEAPDPSVQHGYLPRVRMCERLQKNLSKLWRPVNKPLPSDSQKPHPLAT